MPHGLHHYYQRRKLEKPYTRGFIDKAIYIIGILGPIMTIPQIVKVWVDHEVQGLSLISFVSYIIFNIFWISYGVIHKEKPLVVAYVLWFLINFSMVAGIVSFNHQAILASLF